LGREYVALIRTERFCPPRADHYRRSLIYEAVVKKAQARKDFERIYAEDASFAEVAERLGLASQQTSEAGQETD
jgi:hypothetical protein